MDILDNLCEIDGCSFEGEAEILCDDGKKLVCNIHRIEGIILETSSNEREIKNEVIQNIVKIKETLSSYKKEIAKMAELLVKRINEANHTKIAEILKLERRTDELMFYALRNRRIFSKITENIKKNSLLVLGKKYFDVDLICEEISKQFNRNVFEKKDLIKKSQSQKEQGYSTSPILDNENPENFANRDYLIDYRLTAPYTTVEKKCKLLTKALFYRELKQKEVDFELKQSHVLFEYLKKPKILIVSVRHNKIITDNEERKIILWNIENINESPKYPTNISSDVRESYKSTIIDMFLSIDESFLIVIGSSYIRKIKVPSFHALNYSDLGEGLVNCCKFFSNKKKVALANYDGFIIMFNVENFTIENKCPVFAGNPSGPITCIHVSFSNSIIAIGGRDGSIMFWHHSENRLELIKNADSHKISLISLSKNCRYIISYGNDNKVICIKDREKNISYSERDLNEGICKIFIGKDNSCFIAVAYRVMYYRLSMEPLKSMQIPNSSIISTLDS